MPLMRKQCHYRTDSDSDSDYIRVVLVHTSPVRSKWLLSPPSPATTENPRLGASRLHLTHANSAQVKWINKIHSKCSVNFDFIVFVLFHQKRTEGAPGRNMLSKDKTLALTACRPGLPYPRAHTHPSIQTRGRKSERAGEKKKRAWRNIFMRICDVNNKCASGCGIMILI